MPPTFPFFTLSRMYPEWLEDWWIDRACRELGVPRLEDGASLIERKIRQLSDLFTTAREPRFGEYTRDPLLLLAYGLFFFPQTFARARFPLREAISARGWRPPADRPVRMLDLGAGLGGATFSAAAFLADRSSVLNESLHPVEATAVDASPESLRLLIEIGRAAAKKHPMLKFHTKTGDLRAWLSQQPPGEQWDLIQASFSLGEAFFEQPAEALMPWIDDAMRRLAPEGLLLILEPALRETSERLEKLRDMVSDTGLARIWGPCLHDRPCPLLRNGHYWCHEARSWPTPQSLGFLNRHLFRSIRDLKFSYLLLGRRPPNNPPAADPAFVARMVTPMTAVKGKLIWGGCAGDGERHEYEIQTRDISRAEQRDIEATERGDIIEVREPHRLGDGAYRLPGFQFFRKIRTINPLH